MKPYGYSKWTKPLQFAVYLFVTIFMMQGCLFGGLKDRYKNGGNSVDRGPSGDSSSSDQEEEVEPVSDANFTLEDEIAKLPKGADSFVKACQASTTAGANNLFTQSFCNGQTPPKSIVELFTALGVQGGQTAININTGGLTAAAVTAMNPRVVIFPQNAENTPNGNFCVTAYARDSHGFVEAICRNQNTDINAANNFSLYLFDYDLPCSEQPGGCTNGQVYGPSAESGWQRVSVYESGSLENTVLDCRQCHQNGGATARINLRMPARANPWFGWCRDNRPSGVEVLNVIEGVHGNDAAYAGVAPNQFSNCDPAELEDLVIAVGNGNTDGNGTINSNNLQNESSNATNGTFLPDSSADPANTTFSNDLANDVIASVNRLATENLTDGVSELFPHKTSIIAPVNTVKLNQLTTQYNQFVAGTVADIDDPHTVNTTDPNVLRQAGKMIFPSGLDGEALFRRACAQCHNSALNQNISRALFNVDVNAMGAVRNAEIDKAIERIDLPKESARIMPPVFFATLSEDEKVRLKAYLQSLK